MFTYDDFINEVHNKETIDDIDNDSISKFIEESGQVGKTSIKLTNRQKDVLDFIIKDHSISRRILSEKMGINESAVQKHIEALKKKQVLDRDSATTGNWIVKIN